MQMHNLNARACACTRTARRTSGGPPAARARYVPRELAPAAPAPGTAVGVQPGKVAELSSLIQRSAQNACIHPRARARADTHVSARLS